MISLPQNLTADIDSTVYFLFVCVLRSLFVNNHTERTKTKERRGPTFLFEI